MTLVLPCNDKLIHNSTRVSLSPLIWVDLKGKRTTQSCDSYSRSVISVGDGDSSGGEELCKGYSSKNIEVGSGATSGVKFSRSSITWRSIQCDRGKGGSSGIKCCWCVRCPAMEFSMGWRSTQCDIGEGASSGMGPWELASSNCAEKSADELFRDIQCFASL